MSFKTLQGRNSGGNIVSSRSSTQPTKKMSQGGYLVGPSHEDGGILALVDGEEWIEVEGNEYVIRASSVAKYPRTFLDRLNEGKVDPSALADLKQGGVVKNAKRPKRKLRNGKQVARKPSARRGIKKPSRRTRLKPRPSMTNCASDPTVYCPPPSPGYQGDWYANCCDEIF